MAERVGAGLGRPVVSIDQAIVDRVGMSIAELFDTKGEAAFRRLETEVLQETLDAKPNVIIDGGGGLVVADENRQAIRARGTTVWLDAPNSVLLERIGSFASRPLLDASPTEALARLRRDRLGFYTTAADIIVDTTNRSEPEVAETVVEELEQLKQRDGNSPWLTETVQLADLSLIHI